MAITDVDRDRILGAAKALFQEKKSVSLENLTDYLRTVVNIQVDPSDVEESLTRLFERQGSNLTAIELDQAMVFRRSALAYWMAGYAILVMEEIYKSEPADEKDAVRANVYLFFGIAGDEPQSGKFLGAARTAKDILEYLKGKEIEVGRWHPLDKGQWKNFVPHSSDKIDELVKTFGNSLYSKEHGAAKSITFSL